MADRLRVALIGPGLIAQRHLAVLAAEPGVELVGILGRRLASAEAAATRFGGRPYDDVEALLDRERPDAAWVCVPPDAHGPLELALVERGVHLFVEKPLSADAAIPERVAAAIALAGVVAGVGYHWRALDTIRAVEDALALRPARLVTGAWHDGLPGAGWWRIAARSGGQLVEQATHLVDLSRHLVGEATVLAATADRHDHPGRPGMDVADVSTALLRYEAGQVGVFSATCVLEAASTRELRVLGDGLEIAVSESGVTVAGGRAPARRVATGNDPYRDEDRRFLEAVRTGDRARLYSSYEDALRTHRLTIAMRDAAAADGRHHAGTPGG